MHEHSQKQRQEDAARLWRAGDLSCYLRPHQIEDYVAFRKWNIERQTPEHIKWAADIGALFDNLWVDECGRRHGKTIKWLITDVEEMLQRRGCRGMIATPLQSSIGGIIVPLTKRLFSDAPREYFPRFVTTHEGDGMGLYIEATDSFCKLVGLDKHPDKTRGQFLDFCHITEAAFVKDLDGLTTEVIMPQFRFRPWAWMADESSTAKAPDCDFNRVYREDAKLRGTYRKHPIEDNTSLTPDEIEREYRRSGGRNSPRARRELGCEEVRDEEDMIVPEFDAPKGQERPFTDHVVDPREWEMPRYALCHVGYDPGTTDPHGQVGIYFDWLRQVIVVQWAWAKSNASTGEVVEVTQGFESQFWGTQHRDKPDPSKAPKYKRELSIRDAITTGDAKVWETPDTALTYWDEGEWSFKPNPYSRISDIDNQFVIDLNVDHGMNLHKAEKGPGSKDADTEHLRELFRARPVQIVILKNGHTDKLIEQLRSGMWNTDENGHRTDWERTKTLGHCDCIAALKYVVRDVKWRRNPNPPAHVLDVNASDYHVPNEIRDRARAQALQSFGGRGKHNFQQPTPRRAFR